MLLAGGDFARPSFGVWPSTGDRDRVADVNGEEEDAKASNPERFRFFGGELDCSAAVLAAEMLPKFGWEVVGGEVANTEAGVFFPEERMLGPLAAAKGETDAYAKKPVCTKYILGLRHRTLSIVPTYQFSCRFR